MASPSSSSNVVKQRPTTMVNEASMSRVPLGRARRHFPLILLLVFSVLAWQAAVWTRWVVTDQIHDSASDILDSYKTQLRSELEKFEFLPMILATNGEIVGILSSPGDESRIAAVNRYLEELSDVTRTAVIYVIDSTGLVIASSNWNEPDSFVGINLNYRPYFQTAIEGKIGQYFAMGTTSHERGYYFAAPVQRDGAIPGVTVVKVDIDRFETLWQWSGRKVAITDPLGVIFVSSDPAWRFKTIRPLEAETLQAIRESLQYSDVVLSPLPIVSERRTDDRGSILGIRETLPPRSADALPGQDVVTQDYLVQSVAMPDVGWEIHAFSDMAPVRRMVVLTVVVVVLFSIIILLTGLYLLQRRAVLREKLATREALQKAHDELETKVRERTAELRVSNEHLQREIEERKQAENELVQAGKLAALGQLSAGIVHEVNQPLAAIRSYAANALIFLERQGHDQARSNLVAIDELTERIAGITTRLKTFARKTPGEMQPVAIGTVVAYALTLLEPRIKRDAVEVISDLPTEDVLVWGDAIRLEQVVVNLLKNALEAMHDQDRPGKLYIALEVSAEWVQLVIRDTGPGIAENALPQIFDAFFTTKEIGEGLGLGLSLSNKIVREFGGAMRADNHADGGAVFTVALRHAVIDNHRHPAGT